jgi:hypothetical protein
MSSIPEINAPGPDEFLEEEKRIRVFRFLTDITLRSLYLDPMRLDEARAMVLKLRQKAEYFFPGKGHVFDLVVKPRLERVINKRFLTTPGMPETPGSNGKGIATSNN